MTFGRIQRLLCDEYCQFGDTVLIESPFAETTRDGRGLEQVQLGITPTKLIIAGDYIDTLCGAAAAAWCGLDPALESLELLSLYPVELVELSVLGTGGRQALKATFANRVTRYFELGGHEKRRMFWNLWCERVLQLNPHVEERAPSPSPRTPRSSRSPRTSLHTLESWRYCCPSDNCQWSALAPKQRRWTERDLYLGSKRERQDTVQPTPIPGLGATAELKLLYVTPKHCHLADNMESLSKHHYRLQESTCDFEVYTYTGEPTSNVTYTSITKAYSAGEQGKFKK